MARVILHITRREDWERAAASGVYRSDTLDREGFIHCSTPEQVIRVANARYRSERDLLLLVIDVNRVRAEIRFEGSDIAERFPHIYGPLNVDAVARAVEFPPGEDGRFSLPTGLSGLEQH